MFIEPYIRQQRAGWIEVICGCMFSGKTEELIRRLKRAKIANQKVEIFKPANDVRYHETNIVSHDTNSIHSTPVTHSDQVLLMADNIEVIGIDEAQFFDMELPRVLDTLAGKGIRVIVAGLDMDFAGKPFGPMPELLARAEYATKVHAICMVCGNLASYSFRKSAEKSQVLLGEKDLYEPRCRACFLEGMKRVVSSE
ncbi:MAG: thymidine kinase [Chitinophagaceae bacterium]|nr:thymidine kinase [Chitinophagaceae bacterium]